VVKSPNFGPNSTFWCKFQASVKNRNFSLRQKISLKLVINFGKKSKKKIFCQKWSEILVKKIRQKWSEILVKIHKIFFLFFKNVSICSRNPFGNKFGLIRKLENEIGKWYCVLLGCLLLSVSNCQNIWTDDPTMSQRKPF